SGAVRSARTAAAAGYWRTWRPGLGCEPGGGKIGQQIPELTPGSRGQGPRHPLVELPGRQASPAAPQIFVRANLMCPLDGGRARALRFVKRQLASRFAAAVETSDIDAVLDLLTSDAWL